ncbi:ABC transporter ATP-binding protein/permease [bacterium]|nr:ABC transporter ATP-binding protein/permease [bacterium]MBU1985552.1 ABC transporter ATP-binding protein/permease [bacterium]
MSDDWKQEEEVLGKAYDARLAKRLWSYVGDQRGRIAIAVLLLIVGAAAELAGPVLVKIAIDKHIAVGDWPGLAKIVLAFIGLAFASAIFRWGQMFLTGAAGQFIVGRLRMQLFDKLQRLSIPYYDRNPVGRSMSRLTSDVQALYELFSSGVVAIVGDVVTLIGIVVVMMVINWKLALITLSVIPILIWITFVFRKHVRDLYRQTRTKIARLNSYLHENIIGMRVVQLFNREPRHFEKFDEIGSDLKRTYLRTVLYYALFFPAVDLVYAVAIGLILFGGGNLMLAGAVTLGTLVAFIQYVDRFYRPVRDLAEKYNILQEAMAAAERVFQVLDHPIEVPPASSPVAFDLGVDRGFSVEFRNVWFAYRDEEWVLKDVSFRVEPGESVAVVGATGAGKTTLISLLSRFYDVQRGEILVGGKNIRELDLRALRRAMGIVLQDVVVFAGTIEDNIRYGCPEQDADTVQEAARIVHADRFIRNLPQGYREPVMERGATLSTGERQLLAFARALLCQPPILILDEATASIDTETERLIQDAIARLLEGRTSIIIAHRLSTIQRCSRILVFHHGRLVEQGKPSELLAAKGVYYRLYQLQFGRVAESAGADLVP